MNYRLDDRGEPVPEPDLFAWAEWSSKANRSVGKTVVRDHLVSTVFLAIDHSFGGGPPVLWETMVFHRVDDGSENRFSDVQERYTSRKAAMAGHLNVVEHVRRVTEMERAEKEGDWPETPFVRAMVENPDDEQHRLVFADWLDERGEIERAEFYRTWNGETP